MHGGRSVNNILAGWMWIHFRAHSVVVNFRKHETRQDRTVRKLGKADRFAGVGLAFWVQVAPKVGIEDLQKRSQKSPDIELL